ncbi:hypothetical protein P689_119160 [Candidatus Riesia pediculischaeffi PTSU]|uniref:Uncharacterized protein n=1 Tax=Candidatus Riesia pediculischaeffi PTSU TaxID=1401651 RepID=A0A0C1V6X3_9ENTR|nr:hypothetical protein P689_119160 [Candidatus Riesia pediculischaeffi PTSU]
MFDGVPIYLVFNLTIKFVRAISSVGRASPLQGGGHQFESGIAQLYSIIKKFSVTEAGYLKFSKHE